MFKTKFFGWDDVIAVDFTRTAESVSRRGVDMKVRLTGVQSSTFVTKLQPSNIKNTSNARWRYIRKSAQSHFVNWVSIKTAFLAKFVF